MFDWINFFESNGIDYITSGKNVLSGNINIRCPFCGEDDPSKHLGISPELGYYSCWRDKENHSGKNPVWLIRELKGCSLEEAKEIYGNTEYLNSANLQWFEEKELVKPKLFDWPQNFRKIENKGMTKLHFQYLMGRGYTEDETYDLIAEYDLRSSLDFRWSNRIIIPVFYNVFKKVYGWTARHIGNNELRYVSYPDGKGIKNQLFNYCYCQELHETLIICEGPFDVMNTDLHEGIRSVGLFTTSASDAQISQLYSLKECYENFIILLDQNAESQALTLANQLSMLNPKIGSLPDGVKDPAELNKEQIIEVVEKALQ